MIDIDVEVWTKVAGVVFGGAILAVTGRIATRQKRAEAVGETPPAGMGFVLDGDTALSLLAEVKRIGANLEKWRVEDHEREQATHVKDLEDKLASLQRGQATTHHGQDAYMRKVDEILRRMEVIEKRREQASETGGTRSSTAC